MVQTFSSGGVDIAFVDEGEGRPVLLIHGFASNHRVNWVETGWVRTLRDAGYRVIALDNRGHGASAKLHDPAAYGAPLMADDAAGLLDHLGIESAHVMGYSMGARITAFLSMRHAGRVRSAVFAGLGINMVRGFSNSEPIARGLEAASIVEIGDPVARTFRAFAEQTRSDLPSLAACIRSARDPITRDALAGLTVPVLVAVGSEDAVGGSADELAALIPGAEAFTIPGRDHMKAVGDRQYKAAVLAFLARIDGARAG